MTGAFDEEGQAVLYLFRIRGLSWITKFLLSPLRLAAILGYRSGQNLGLHHEPPGATAADLPVAKPSPSCNLFSICALQ